MEPKFMHGTPPLALFPAKNYIFKISEDNYIIEIPRSGKYSELAPEIFDAAAGEFNIYDEESKTFYLPSITKVLFATKQYPDLKFNQFFVPYVLKLEDNKVTIVGQVVDMMVKVDNEEKEEVES
jgi:hypothetical protein